MSRLEPSPEPPFQTASSELLARSGRLALRFDRVVWPDGMTQDYTVVEGPQAAVVVPLFEDETTVLVRQWRHPWNEASWEFPSGTLNDDEDPLAGAKRELAEEAGLVAGRWTSLGTGRPSASTTIKLHYFLAQDLVWGERSPEAYERDMIVRQLPLAEVLAAAVEGEIGHAGSLSALLRATHRREVPGSPAEI
jgi:ADP-ribose pyrophosphatase